MNPDAKHVRGLVAEQKAEMPCKPKHGGPHSFRARRNALSGLVLAAASVAIIGLALPAEAEPAQNASRERSPEISCQDQLLLDRRDNPQRALKNFYACNTVRSVKSNLEYFTFWYVTLPPPVQEEHHKKGTFAKVWRNYLAMLEKGATDFQQERAFRVLDDSIAEGMRRGRRADLIDKWRAGHDPEIFLPARPMAPQPPVKPAVASAAAEPIPAPPAAAVPPGKPVAASVSVTPEKAAPTRRAHPQVRRARTRPARSYAADRNDPDQVPVFESAAAAPPAGWYGASAFSAEPYSYEPVAGTVAPAAQYPLPTAYAIQPYPVQSYPVQPYAGQQYPGSGVASQPGAGSYAPPSDYASTQAVPGANLPASPAVYSSPASYPAATPGQSAAPRQLTAPELIGQQIDRNFQTISDLIGQNLRTVERVLFR